jgi:hypothetical protein
VAYHEVGEPRHRLLHRRVAEALEAIYGKQYLDGIAGILAWHLARAATCSVRRHASVRLNSLNKSPHGASDRLYEQALAADLPDRNGPRSCWNWAKPASSRRNRAGCRVYRAALKLCAPQSMEAIGRGWRLAQSLLNQARYAEAIDLAKQILADGRPEMIVSAEAQWGTTLSIEGADLSGAQSICRTPRPCCVNNLSSPMPPSGTDQIRLGSVARSAAILEEAVALYRDTIGIGAQDGQALPFRVLGYNNLAYHLYLLHDPTATEYAPRLQLAREQGALGLQPFSAVHAGRD